MVRAIAFYLPQFHPIPENDEWWGQGFTEWRKVATATPLFSWHYQPHLPADLGFCDLRLPEARQAQADLAREYGVHGFCYYHYWFQGRRLLERPFNEVLASGKPDFPFCLCWANENWTRRWDGEDKEMLLEQTYSEEDDLRHIRWLINAFRDPRYIRVNGKPLFLIYRGSSLPDARRTFTLWREEARKAGVGNLYVCKVESNFASEIEDPAARGFDAAVEFQPDNHNPGPPLRRTKTWQRLARYGLAETGYLENYVYDYAAFVERMLQKPEPPYRRFPCVTLGWDNTARRKVQAFVLKGFSLPAYEKWLRTVVENTAGWPEEERLVFINAWNEWAEGVHLEPDHKYGKGYLEATRRALTDGANDSLLPGRRAEVEPALGPPGTRGSPLPSVDMSPIKELFKAASRRVPVLGSVVRERDYLRGERDRLVAELDQQVVERDRLVAECGRLAAECGRIVGECNRLVAEHDRRVAERDQLVAERDRLVAERTELALPKQVLTQLAKLSLRAFLDTGSFLDFPPADAPELSIILVLYNRAELTLACLSSLRAANLPACELILVDNASTDETAELLGRLRGATVIANNENLHYLRACNQAARRARGEYLLLLNNDTQVLADSINAALRLLKGSENIGVVGGKLILPDGTLQEAGSIIWQDGTSLGYGRGDSPFAPPYMFRRDVDFCSAAFLLTRRSLFADGWFDEAFCPAYYEEADYCFRLWKRGQRVVYDPDVVVLHMEFASSGSAQDVIDLMRKNRLVFIRKHGDWLQHQMPHAEENLLPARGPRRRPGTARVLFLNDRIPHPSFGAGDPRASRIISGLTGLGTFVTVYALSPHDRDASWASAYADNDRAVEIMLPCASAELPDFLRARKGYYDIILVSGLHNKQHLDALLSQGLDLGGTRVVCDAVALTALQDIARQRVAGDLPPPEKVRESIGAEVELAGDCWAVSCVSELEARWFREFGVNRVYVLGHAVDASPTPNPFDQREDLLFVGALHASPEPTPNADSVHWFSKEVFPHVRRMLGQDVRFLIAGTITDERVHQLANGLVQVLGRQDRLDVLYNRARLFVAPTRFAAGIPLKVLDAAAHGLPVIGTSLVAEQLGWRDEVEMLVADRAEDFAEKCALLYQDRELWKQIRSNALDRVEREYSVPVFSQKLQQLVSDCLSC